jgi:predicted CoA-binding protein
METMLNRAQRFLEHRRIAIVGVARDEKDFSRGVLRALQRRGYDVVPVNPAMGEVDGQRCFARLMDVQPPVEAALVMTSRGRTGGVVEDCVRAGVRAVWLHRGAGPGAASPEAVEICRANAIDLVTDLCPYMALPGAGAMHGFHRVLRGVACWFRGATTQG